MDSTPIHHPSSQKNEMLIFLLCSTSDDWPGWLMDSNPIHYPSPAKKMKCSYLYYIQLLMIGRAGRLDLNPIHLHSPAKKNEMLIFGLRSTSDDQPGWLINLNPICHPCPAKKMKCSFLNYVELLIVGWAVNGLKCHPPPVSSQGMKCSFLNYIQLLMIGRAGRWTRTPSTTHIQPKKWNACFWIMFNFWWSAGLVNGLKPQPPPISSQKNEMLIFGLLSISGDQPGWSMDSNAIHHPSPAKKMKC